MRKVVFSLLMVAGLTACDNLPSTPIDAPLRPGKVVVFDIDGTLTPENIDVMDVRPRAVDVVKAYSNRGYRVLYLTARSTHLQRPIPYWLNRKGFPKGDLQTAQTYGEHENPALFKERMLKNYQAAGWTLAYAYGDSATDFIAYAAVGIPKENVFALLREDDRNCQPGEYAVCLRGYVEHLPFVDALQTLPRN